MKLTLNQTKLVGLTMELELKTKEYNSLCREFDELKEKGNLNEEKLENMLLRFSNNQEEIKKILKELNQIKEN